MAATSTLVAALEAVRELSPEDRAAVVAWLRGAGRAGLRARGVTEDQIGPPLDGIDRTGPDGVAAVLQRLLVPVDGSEQAERAVALALAIAGERAGCIVFCHIIRAPDIAPMGDYGEAAVASAVNEAGNGVRAKAQAVLDHAADRARAAGIAVDTAIADGDFVDAILRLARERTADAIVIGTHGRRGLERFIIGSLAEAVLRRSTIPVLVVRTP